MKQFNITFLALSRSTDMEIKSETEIDEIMNDLLLIFASEIDYENFKINIESLQQNTEEFRNKIDTVVQKYKSSEPRIQQLNSYFKDLKDGEHFFLFPDANFSQEQRFQFYNYLSALESGSDYEKLTQDIDALFGVLRSKYEITAFDENTKSKIGVADKSKRICRFCNKSMTDGVTFRKIAHSISEALGNKKIITNDECDSCNEKFGSGIENHLILYLNLYRNIFGIKGKNGIPKLKGKNFEIENNGKIEIKHFLTEEEEKDENRDDFSATLETNQDIIGQNVYRTLSKYALSVIDREEIKYFTKTVQWINGEFDSHVLPKVALLTSYDLFSHHPKLVVYIRKDEDKSLPFAVAEFRFTFQTFVFIIPHSSEDEKDFSNDADYANFWDFFKHYNSVSNWTFKNMTDVTPRKFTMHLKFEQRKNDD